MCIKWTIFQSKLHLPLILPLLHVDFQRTKMGQKLLVSIFNAFSRLVPKQL